MIPLYLNQSAHIIDQICESDVEGRPHHSDSSEKQSLHALLHEAIDMFDAVACLRLDPVVFFLFFCKRLVSVSFSIISGLRPFDFTVSSVPTYASRTSRILLLYYRHLSEYQQVQNHEHLQGSPRSS